MQNPIQILLEALRLIGVGLVASLPRIFLGFVLFVIILQVARIAQATIIRGVRRSQAGLAVEQLLSRTAYLAILAVGALTGLSVAGIDVTGFLAGLGLTGFAVSLALKDTIENLISGVMLLIQRPFVIGDIISVEGQEGEVVELSIRVTRLRTEDALEVIIPNSKIFNNILINKTHYPVRRFTATFNVSQATPLAQATTVFLNAIRTIPGVLADPPPTLTWTAVNKNMVTAQLHYWLDARQPATTALPSQVLRTLKDTAAQSNIELV